MTVAQGAHWFDLARFYAGVRRVAVPGAVIAIWGYSYCRVDAAVERVVAERLLEVIEPYWAQGNRVIAGKHQTIDFPFAELPWPGFEEVHSWLRRDFLGYMATWSAYRRYVATEGRDPLPELDRALALLWPDAERRSVVFDFVGRVGRL